MQLKTDLPIYELKLPSSGKSIRVRPFIVKEEKLLLMAIEAGDERSIIDTTKQVIGNCILDEGISIDDLPFFDVDYLFISLRAKSIGESIDINFTCNNEIQDGVPCNNVFPAKIDVSNVKVVEDVKIPNDIKISPKQMVRMKYPSYTTMKWIIDDENILNKKIRIVAGSIEYIVDGEKVITMKDITIDELVEFIEGLTQEQFKKLEEFIDNFPSFVIQSKAKCNKCGFDHELEYREFTSFFA